MYPINLPKRDPQLYSRKISHINFDGYKWVFNSDWGWAIAKFILNKVNDDRYEGSSYTGNNKESDEVWVRVG